MNQLTKLIQQYEAENPGKKAKTEYTFGRVTIKVYTDEFVLCLASRSTCGKEQRKFLDEVELVIYRSDDTFVVLNQRFKTDLQKVIKGK